jgi:hypothetical protein
LPNLTPAEADALRRRAGAAMGKRPVPTRKEKEIQRAVLDYLATVPGVVAWKSGGGMFRMTYKGKERMVRMGVKGVSDIIGWYTSALVIPGTPVRTPHFARFLAIEVKRPGRYPTDVQTAFLKQVELANGIAIVARSVADVQKVLGGA